MRHEISSRLAAGDGRRAPRAAPEQEFDQRNASWAPMLTGQTEERRAVDRPSWDDLFLGQSACPVLPCGSPRALIEADAYGFAGASGTGFEIGAS